MLRLIAAVLVVIASLGAATADAAPPPLRAEQSGSLPGGIGGAFAYYEFAYPGGWPMTIELIPHTKDQAILRHVGFNLYGPRPNHVYVEGRVDENGVFIGKRELNSQDRGLYLLQVYHYHPNQETVLNYTVR